MQQKITPNLWFDGNAREAVDYYTSLFPGGETISTVYYPASAEEGLADFQLDMANKELAIDFELGDQHFTAINAGPEFRFNQSISFMINFASSQDDDAGSRIDEVWGILVDGGEVLMPIDRYPFSQRYGWVKDRYGLTWQLSVTSPDDEPRPFIMPALLFSGENVNRAQEAVDFYLSVFMNTKQGVLATYEEVNGPAMKGSLMFGDFMLEGQWFAAMDSGVEQEASFNEAVSFAVTCRDQAEIDYYWEKLSSVPSAEQCGWCKDRFGVSWQIVPENMDQLLRRPNAYAAMMQMKKLIIADF